MSMRDFITRVLNTPIARVVAETTPRIVLEKSPPIVVEITPPIVVEDDFRRRAHDRLSADTAACACPVLDNECLPKPLRQRLPHEARNAVGCLACRKGNDDAHRPRRIGLRPRDPRYGRERGSTRCQM